MRWTCWCGKQSVPARRRRNASAAEAAQKRLYHLLTISCFSYHRVSNKRRELSFFVRLWRCVTHLLVEHVFMLSLSTASAVTIRSAQKGKRGTYLDLDLVPPIPSGTLGDEFLPSAAVTRNSFCSSPGNSQSHPIAYRSSLKVASHVFCGLRCFRLPMTRSQFTCARRPKARTRNVLMPRNRRWGYKVMTTVVVDNNSWYWWIIMYSSFPT